MQEHRARSTQVGRSVELFTIMLLAIFATELAVTELFDLLGSRLALPWSAIADALLLTLFSAPPLWIVCKHRFSEPRSDGSDVPSRAPVTAVALVLASIFLIEVVVMTSLPQVMPLADGWARDLADACLVTLFSAPILWWLLFPRKTEPRRIQLTDLLTIPLRL